jgi:hypothetical protein
VAKELLLKFQSVTIFTQKAHDKGRGGNWSETGQKQRGETEVTPYVAARQDKISRILHMTRT